MPDGLKLAWPLIANFSCSQSAAPGSCARTDNMGWRYLLFTLGGCTLLLWAFRFFVFKLEESPRFLVGRGRDADAVAVLQRIATYNGTSCSLSVEDLKQAGEAAKLIDDNHKRSILSSSSDYTVDHVRALFKTKKLAWSTSLLISIWGS
jgi:hypothetical protein